MNDLDALLREARRRLMRVRIEEHRLKAIMARLEACVEEQTANRLGRLLAEHADDDLALAAALDAPPDDSPAGYEERSTPGDDPSTPREDPPGPRDSADSAGPRPEEDPRKRADTPLDPTPDLAIRIEGRPRSPTHQGRSVLSKGRKTRGRTAARNEKKRSRTTKGKRPRRVPRRSPWLASIAVHVLVLFVLGVLTMAALHEPEARLSMTIGQPSETEIAEVAEIQITPAELETVPLETSPLDVEPAELEADSSVVLAEHLEPLAESDSGEYAFAELPLGRAALLEAGGEGAGTGEAGDSEDAASPSLPTIRFFGAEARANRIAFVVDNSNSMDDGRFETALLELALCIDALTPEQSFYVVFYSDTAYGLFHPNAAAALVPATRENKLLLREWLDTVEMCVGGRIVDAFKVVQELEPQVVYLLSDGEINSEYALSYLTERRPWEFAIHTIGMTVASRNAAENLLRIAQSNSGVFRPVGVSPMARVMHARRRIKKNSSRGPVWGIRLPP